jgi:hypothetical protein
VDAARVLDDIRASHPRMFQEEPHRQISQIGEIGGPASSAVGREQT